MRRIWRVSLSGLWAFSLIGASAFAGVGSVGVYVYDLKTGGEVRAYTVRIVGSRGTDLSQTVGNTNYARFNNLPTNEIYTLTVTKDGYYSRSIPGIIVSAGYTRNFNLALTPTSGVPALFSISGRVVDALTNQPIPNAYIVAYRSASGQSYRRVDTVADSQGRFTITHCIPGGYYIYAYQVGYYNSPNFVITASNTINDVVLPCTPHGTPIGGFEISRVYDALNGNELRALDAVLQSEAGWSLRYSFWDGYRLERLPANLRYSVTVSYRNTPDVYYPSTRVGFTLVSGTYVSHNFYLVPGDVAVGTLSGVVRNLVGGAPVANAWVGIRYGDRWLSSMYTDSQGRYSFANLPLGYNGLVVGISKPGWISYSWLLDALTSSNTNNDLFIRAEGVPAGGRDFYVYDQTTGDYIPATLQIRIPSGHTSRVALPDGYGDRISGLPAWQTYDFTVTAPGYRSVTWLNQQVPYDTWWNISIYLPRSNQTVGRVIGVVRDLITGNPISNAQVSCFGAVTTDSQGRFTLENQPLGSYTLSVSASGYISRSVQITIRSGDNLMDFFLIPLEHPRGRVYGYVRSENDGWGIVNSTVTAVAPNGLTLTYHTGPQSSYYDFPDLPHDIPFTFVASASGYIPAQVENFYPRNGDTHQIDFSLQPDWGGLRMRHFLRGQVLLEGFRGNPKTIWLTVEAYQHSALVWRRDVRLEPDGTFEVECPLTEVVDLRLKADRWLSCQIDQFDTASGEIPLVRFNHLGDVNNDDQIDDNDLVEILFQFGEKTPNPPDLNGDGWVDDADLFLALMNFGAHRNR